jgi:uncharacterized protein (DUF1015 family)
MRYAAASLDEALCPPYDVIGPELARELRSRPRNAVFLELPKGAGAARYANAKSVWKKWTGNGTLVRDSVPAFYVIEETYKLAGRTRVRRGFLAALGATPKAAKAIIPHERTLAKPKADRLRMIDTLRVNTSPIFGVFADPTGAARKALASATKSKPVARGRSHAGVAYRVWRVDEPKAVGAIRRALAPRPVLIADGHHRYSVSRDHHLKTRLPGSDAVLCYFVPDEDAGLVVLPTHRIAAKSLRARAESLATLKKFGTLAALEAALARAKNPYAFGLIESGYHLGTPKSANGCRSGLAVEWIGGQLLGDTAPDQLSYTPDAALAQKKAKAVNGAAVLVKPFSVAQVRAAARKVGLLPQKSTYFFPKIATGLVFRPLAP